MVVPQFLDEPKNRAHVPDLLRGTDPAPRSALSLQKTASGEVQRRLPPEVGRLDILHVLVE